MNFSKDLTFFRSLLGNDSLRILKLSNNSLNKDGIELLNKYLEKTTNLKELSINGNNYFKINQI